MADRGCRRESCAGDCDATKPKFRRALDVIADRRPDDVIEGIAAAGKITVIASESGAGKTFALLSMAAAVSDDRPWHGRLVEQGTVAYFSFEADALGLRLAALRSQGWNLENLFIFAGADPISPRIGRDGRLTANEVALIDYLKRESPNIHPDLKAAVARLAQAA